MRDVLARYWVVAHIAFLAAFLAWAHGGSRIELLIAVPWLCLAALEMTVLFPPVRKREAVDDARQRTRRALCSDPLLFAGGLFCLYLLWQYLNGGCSLEFSPANSTWGFSSAPLGWGPFCVVPSEAVQLFYLIPVSLVAALCVRHGTNRRGKLVLLRAVVANGALISLCGIIQRFSGGCVQFWKFPASGAFFAAFSYNHAGAFFTLLFVIGIGLLVQALLIPDERRHAVWLGVVMGGNFAGALLSGSRTAVLLSLALLVLGGWYGVRHAWRQVETGVRLKAVAVVGVMLVFGACALFFLIPENLILREIHTVPWSQLGEGTFGLRWPQTVSAWNIWLDHPWFGVGGGGYRHFALLGLDDSRRALFFHGGEFVHDDLLQFLVEHGVIGFGMIVSSVVMLLFPVVQRLRFSLVSHVDGWTGEPWLVFRVSPLTIMLLAATTVTFLQSLIDLPFRSPAILVTWCIALACAPAFLPSSAPGIPVHAGPLRNEQVGPVQASASTPQE